MTRRIVLSILLALVILAGVAGLGVYAYKAGEAQGLLQSDKLPALVPEGGRGFYPYHHFGAAFYHRPFGFGFGCFGLLLPLLFLFLLFGLLRALLWPRPWGWRHGWHGPWGRGPWNHKPGDSPPFFEEWHKRAHGETQAEDTEKV